MEVTRQSSPFGSESRTRVLAALRLLESSYARELARLLEVRLSSVQKALLSLERDGLVSARAAGRTRIYRLNPTYFARNELRAFLTLLADVDSDLQRRAALLRRRPRRTGKPL